MVETDTADSTFVVTDLQPFTVFFLLFGKLVWVMAMQGYAM